MWCACGMINGVCASMELEGRFRRMDCHASDTRCDVLHDQSVGDILAGSFTGANDADDLAASHAIVA